MKRTIVTCVCYIVTRVAASPLAYALRQKLKGRWQLLFHRVRQSGRGQAGISNEKNLAE